MSIQLKQLKYDRSFIVLRLEELKENCMYKSNKEALQKIIDDLEEIEFRDHEYNTD